jgi:hypothetical protein
MNIESILNKIYLFEELTIKSGFKRDVIDFIGSIQQAQNRNLVFMKGLSETIKNQFQEFENNSLESELEHILKESEPFTYAETVKKLSEIDENKEIDGSEYYQEFITILNELQTDIESNETEINEVKELFIKYVSTKDQYESENEQALVSLIFKDLESTGSLKEFSRVLNRWNRTLIIYHTLLKSESPEEISLVEIQNGSIDVIFNIDFDIALDLTELLKTGLKVYSAYLVYKTKKAKEIIASYMGNKKLIDMETKREILMLDNIKDSIKKQALQQHKVRIKQDKEIEKAGATKKADEVSRVLTDHIIRGNEMKLLTALKPEDEEEENTEDISTELRKETAKVRERYKELNLKEKQLLLDKYGIKKEDE